MPAKLTAIRLPFTKAKLINAIAEDTGLNRKQVESVFDSLYAYIHRHLKRRSGGTFTLPGLIKLTVSTRKATKARIGTDPLGRPISIPKKPPRRVVRVRTLKALKDMANS